MPWPFFSLRKRVAQNNRRFQRTKIPLVIRYRVTGEAEDCISDLKDLAAVGVRFTTTRDIRPSKRVRVTIKFPWSEEPFRAWAKVVRCVQIKKGPVFCIAARFVGLEKSKVVELESLVDGIVQGRRNLIGKKIGKSS